MADEKMFLEAKQAIQDGQKERARDLLTRILKTDQKNPDYWLYMSAVVESTSEKIFCLESALRIDPQNQAALRGLVLLGARPADESIVPVPVVRRKWTLGIEPEEELPKNPLARLMRNPVARVVAFLAAGAILVGLVWLSITSLVPERKTVTFIQVSTTPKPIDSYLPTKTATQPSPTPRVRTPIPTFIGPTPLWMLLKETYTPTPRYIDTPHPIYESYRTGMRSLDRGDYKAMINYMLQAARDDATSADLPYYLGEAYRLSGDTENALKAYEQAILVNPNFAPAYLRRAQMLLATDPEAEVSEDFLKAIQLDPNFFEGYLELAAYDLRLGNYEAALADLKTVEEKAPYEPRLYIIKAQVLLKQGEYKSALEYAQKAYDMDQTQLPVYLALAQASWYNDKPKEAQKLIETYLLYEDQDPQAWLIYGLSAFQNGDREAAFKAMDKALALDERLPDAYRYRGLLYLESGEGQKAVNDLVEAVRFKPNDFEINLELGRALLVAERYMDAYKQLNSTQDLAETDAQLAEVFYWRGRTLEAGSNPNAAEVDYLALLALPSESVPPAYISFAKARLVAIKSPTPTASSTSTKTLTPTVTPTPTPTPTRTRTATPTVRPSATATATPTLKPSTTATASQTSIPSKTSPASKTPAPSRTPTKTAARTATRTP
jgi:tetratricopeptide (TPR) repeat protein